MERSKENLLLCDIVWEKKGKGLVFGLRNQDRTIYDLQTVEIRGEVYNKVKLSKAVREFLNKRMSDFDARGIKNINSVWCYPNKYSRELVIDWIDWPCSPIFYEKTSSPGYDQLCRGNK